MPTYERLWWQRDLRPRWGLPVANRRGEATRSFDPPDEPWSTHRGSAGLIDVNYFNQAGRIPPELRNGSSRDTHGDRDLAEGGCASAPVAATERDRERECARQGRLPEGERY
jgi:hypothetical protein